MNTTQASSPLAPRSSSLGSPLGRLGISELRIETVRYFLRQQSTLREMSEADLRDLATAAVVKPLKENAYLFHRHEPAVGLFFIRRGIVNLHRIAVDGREVVIHFYREGELLAKIPDEGGRGGRADARAVVDSEIVMIPWRNFVEKCRRCPDLALRLLASIGRQVDELTAAFEDFVSADASTRFVHWVLRRCTEGNEEVEIDLGTTKRMLASELGVRQETLSRTLRQLSDSGYLEVRGRHITVKNPQGLRSHWGEGCVAAA